MEVFDSEAIHAATVWWFISTVISEVSDKGLAKEGDSIEQLIF